MMVIVSYDVANNEDGSSRLRKVSKICSNYGLFSRRELEAKGRAYRREKGAGSGRTNDNLTNANHKPTRNAGMFAIDLSITIISN
jgi:hypothetical protein